MALIEKENTAQIFLKIDKFEGLKQIRYQINREAIERT
jgi:hypothetical protein